MKTLSFEKPTPVYGQMNFQVFTYGEVQHIQPPLPYAVVSILPVGDRPHFPGVSQTENCVEVLELDFDDVDDNSDPNAMTIEHAEKIIDFYIRNKDKVNIFVAHCNAGVSRSPAVAAVLEKIHTGNDNRWFRFKTPNRLVYNYVLNAAHDRGLI